MRRGDRNVPLGQRAHILEGHGHYMPVPDTQCEVAQRPRSLCRRVVGIMPPTILKEGHCPGPEDSPTNEISQPVFSTGGFPTHPHLRSLTLAKAQKCSSQNGYGLHI